MAASKKLIWTAINHRYHLRSLIFLLIFALILPASGAAGLVIVRLSATERRADETRNLGIARAFSAGIDRELLSAQAALQALAVSSDLQRGDLAAFYRQCIEVAAQHDARIVLADRDGFPVLNTLRPFGTSMPRIHEHEAVRVAISAGRVQVSDLFQATTTGDPLVALLLPVARAGGGNWVLIMSFAPEQLSQLFAQQSLPEEWTIAVIDRHGRVLGRNRALDRFLGQPVSPDLRSAMQVAAEGSAILHTKDGTEVYTAFARSNFTGWTVAFGIPRGIVEAPFQRSLLWIGISGLVILILCGSIALGIAYRITRSMRGLSHAALALGEGRPLPEISSGISEMDRVISAMEQADTSLRRRSEERDRAEADLREAKTAAEAASRAKSDFLANTSHELRTPLNAVIGFSELLEAGIAGPIAAEQAQYLADIHRSGVHLLGVINDILDIAKADSGRIKLHETQVDLRNVVEACIKQTAPQVDAGSLDLSVCVAANVPCVIGDEPRLKQILLNLLSNAVKFSKPGGAIVLSVGSAVDGDIVCSVSDSGPGMDSAEIKLALEPFTQVDGGLARRHDGTGLGLPLAHRLTELHGGVLRVDSHKGRGTKVSFTLPGSRTRPTVKAA